MQTHAATQAHKGDGHDAARAVTFCKKFQAQQMPQAKAQQGAYDEADRIGQTYRMRHNPAHRWYYYPQMQRDEALVFKVYDSQKDGRSRFTPHTSFADPDTPADAPPRQSIEVRTLAFF